MTLAEQHGIVTELDGLQAEVDVLKRLQAECATEFDAPMFAIRDRAFTGEFEMSVTQYKRYVVCPECKNELIAERLKIHFQRAHKKTLSAEKMADILSRMTRESTRKQAQPVPHPPRPFSARQKKRDQADIEKAMKEFAESTPFPMRQWGADRPHRTGPL